ncbi:MAG: carboxypeptidase regulatory-like domain-containing protein [Acidobacteriota bacterium]|nr:carboxypeptidase-like regulatory domain-containing protein [Pyrinomonadaceae bacterium]MDW8303556.1 carboxypeptidase regulatory-like domain-containing protein [Acidobacteriota bacterium]
MLKSILLTLLFLLTAGIYSQTPNFEKDREMAEFIRRVTNRTSEGLTEIQTKNGVIVDLQGRFQNVVLARIDESKFLRTACVVDLNEANLFFGRNLETGEPIFSGLLNAEESLYEVAKRHGMSSDEFIFYKNLIQQFNEGKLGPASSTITIVNNDGAGEGFNDTTPATPEGGNTGTTLGQQRLNVFNYAASIWSAFLDSGVTILVRSNFDPLTCTATSAVLGSAGTISVVRDFPGAQFTSTWYHVALANKRNGSDLVPASPDIQATFNSSLNGNPSCLGGWRFYMGYDNSTPPNTINLLVVVLHELGHGLGFSSFVNGSNGQFFMGFPDVYTTFMFDRTVNLYWNNMTNTQRQASATNANNVLWDGANVRIASGFLTAGRESATGRVELYTPSTFSSGSSISHWNTSATPNLLMEPFITVGLPLTLDLTRQQTRDIGWYRDTTNDLIPDTITNVAPSNVILTVGSTAQVTWTNTGGFNRPVIIELSTNGGSTYPITLGTNITNTGSFTFVVPNTPTAQARIRVREDNFVEPSGVSPNFIITTLSSASVSVSGRVIGTNGRGVASAIVRMVSQNGIERVATTNPFGYYYFTDVEIGAYIFSVKKKGTNFADRAVNITEDIYDLNFTALP